MRKTNCKEVRNYFNEYLTDILTDWFDGSLLKMSQQFRASTSNAINNLSSAYESYQDAFKEITWNYATPYFAEQKEMLMEALDQTEEEASKYTDQQTEHLFNYLLYKAYCNRCKKENVDFYSL
jgi:hypothetical protein